VHIAACAETLPELTAAWKFWKPSSVDCRPTVGSEWGGSRTA
jgi:hypothetical protein